MSQEFTIPNKPALTKIVDTTMTGAYGSYEEMKSALRNHLGMPAPEAETLAMPPAPTTQVPPLSAPAQQGSNHTHERVCYPSGNDRYILTGFSDEELDRKEAAIKAALGVQ